MKLFVKRKSASGSSTLRKKTGNEISRDAKKASRSAIRKMQRNK